MPGYMVYSIWTMDGEWMFKMIYHNDEQRCNGLVLVITAKLLRVLWAYLLLCAVAFWWSWLYVRSWCSVMKFLLGSCHNMYNNFRCCWFIWCDAHLIRNSLWCDMSVEPVFFCSGLWNTQVYIVSLVFNAFCSKGARWLLVTVTIYCYYIGYLLCHVLITSKHCVVLVLYTARHTEHRQVMSNQAPWKYVCINAYLLNNLFAFYTVVRLDKQKMLPEHDILWWEVRKKDYIMHFFYIRKNLKDSSVHAMCMPEPDPYEICSQSK